jgi:hypothetical protein
LQQHRRHLEGVGARSRQQDARRADDRRQQIAALPGEWAVAGGMADADRLGDVPELRTLGIASVAGIVAVTDWAMDARF